MNKAIGGYYDLELPLCANEYRNGIRLATGRMCLEYILRVRQYKHVYMPYYTCEVMLRPMQALNIDYTFYSIDGNLEPLELPTLNENEAFVYVNYFGLKDDGVSRLAERYGKQLIVDNALAFYSKQKGGDQFFTAYKFFGVSDGAYLEMNESNPFELLLDLPQDTSFGRMKHLLWRIDTCAEDGFPEFHRSKASMEELAISRMSNLTQRILGTINYDEVATRRRANYSLLQWALKDVNMLSVANRPLREGEVPMVYPLLLKDDSMRNKMFDERVYPARYWPNVLDWCKENSIEYQLAKNILALPIDQRYGEEEMQIMIKMIKKEHNE